MKKFLAKLFGITRSDLPGTPEGETAKTTENETTGEINVHGKINDNGQIELKIDWDDSFIAELKANGYNGANEDVIIQMYLATLHRRLMEEQQSDQQFN